MFHRANPVAVSARDDPLGLFHPPDARTCAACDLLRRSTGIDLADYAAVQHEQGYDVMRRSGARRAWTVWTGSLFRRPEGDAFAAYRSREAARR